MGTIVLGDEIAKQDFDRWRVVLIRCYDVCAQEAAFVDMRHSFVVVDLEKTQYQKMTGWQKFLNCFFKTKDIICKQWHGSRCACCICRQRHGYRIRKGIEDRVTLHLQVTGNARKGPFLNQLIDDNPFSYPDVDEDYLVLKPLDFCCKNEQLLVMAKLKQDIRYGDLRKHLIEKFYNTRYDVKLRNCYHFLIEALNFCGVESDVIKERCDNIVTDVRKHKYVTPVVEKLVDKVSPLL